METTVNAPVAGTRRARHGRERPGRRCPGRRWWRSREPRRPSPRRRRARGRGRAGELGAWITRVDAGRACARPRDDLAGDEPISGWTVAVKDNIDVGGLPTTAGHPGVRACAGRHRTGGAGARRRGRDRRRQDEPRPVRDRPGRHAIAVRRRAATRTRPTTSRADRAPARRSRSRSARPTSAIGTDTAGSGRVPAALCGIVGLQADARAREHARGRAGDRRARLRLGARPVGRRGGDRARPHGRTSTPAIRGVASLRPARPRSVPGPLRIGVPRPVDLDGLDADAARAWHRRARVARRDRERRPRSISRRTSKPARCSTTARSSPRAGTRSANSSRRIPTAPIRRSTEIVARRARPRCRRARRRHRARCNSCAGRSRTTLEAGRRARACRPSAPHRRSLRSRADPVGVNAALGRFTNGDQPARPLRGSRCRPARAPTGCPFGISFSVAAFADAIVATAAARFVDEPDPAPPRWTGWATVVVIGAHLTGQPLNHQLTDARRPAAPGDVDRAGLPAPRVGHRPAEAGARPGRRPAARRSRPSSGSCRSIVSASSCSTSRRPSRSARSSSLDGSRHPGFLCEGARGRRAHPTSRSFGGWLAYREAQR